MNKKLYIITGLHKGKPFLDYTWSVEKKESDMLKSSYPDLDYLGFSNIKVIEISTAVHKDDILATIDRQLIKPLKRK